ncbi:(2Fe-2S)-binding protein [Acidothermaceae bacterium B102]|nr:(2Fe-2S)-binding protein [Acidothermaceae bacterium B102]
MPDELAALGPYFAVGRHDPSVPPEGEWRPLRVLLSSPDALRDRAEQVQSALAAGAGQPVELRVAASVAHLGLVARLVAPAFGAAVLDARLLELDEARWQPVLGGPAPLSLSEGALEGVPYDGPLVVALGRTWQQGPVRGLAEQARSLSVAATVSAGNVASAVNGTAVMVARSRPDLAERALAMAAELLTGPVLEGRSEGEPGKNFRRLSCCLIYRAAPRGPRVVCGDCILASTS